MPAGASAVPLLVLGGVGWRAVPGVAVLGELSGPAVRSGRGAATTWGIEAPILPLGARSAFEGGSEITATRYSSWLTGAFAGSVTCAESIREAPPASGSPIARGWVVSGWVTS